MKEKLLWGIFRASQQTERTVEVAGSRSQRRAKKGLIILTISQLQTSTKPIVGSFVKSDGVVMSSVDSNADIVSGHKLHGRTEDANKLATEVSLVTDSSWAHGAEDLLQGANAMTQTCCDLVSILKLLKERIEDKYYAQYAAL